MPVEVSDFRANKNETIVHAAKVLENSKARRVVFAAIYRGGAKPKTVRDLVRATRMNRVRVAQIAGALFANQVITRPNLDGELAYGKDPTLAHYKRKILTLAEHPKRQNKLATKQRPHGAGSTTIRVHVGARFVAPKFVSIDELDSFAKVKKFKADPRIKHNKVAEIRVKKFLLRILCERETQGDWGGEKNDLFSTKLVFRKKRTAAAFALKGKATSGPLTPKKLGKNGDQIGRLVSSAASVFFVVYHSKIEESVHEQIRAYASVKAAMGTPLYYGVIDGDDLSRLRQAYPKCFK